jgi:hypothetical protein
VVWIRPLKNTGKGATLTTAITHIAVQEQLDGKAVDLIEYVSDEQDKQSKGA